MTPLLAKGKPQLQILYFAMLKISSIPIHERVELPESWIPADSRVEIDAKITAGMWFRLPTQHILVIGLNVTRILHHWTSDDRRGACCCEREKLGGVRPPSSPVVGESLTRFSIDH